MKYMTLNLAALISIFAFTLRAAEDVAGAVEGTVTKVDRGAKTVALKTADGAEHTYHVADRTAVHGAKETERGSKDAFEGMKRGGHVVVHYSRSGAEETAEEVDHVGKGGMRAAEGAVSHVDRDAKTVTVKTAHGGEETYHLAENAARDAGKDVGRGAEKSGKVTVYYTEEAGRKVAHFVKGAF